MSWNFDISEAPKGHYVERVAKGRHGDRIIKGYHAPRIIAAGNGGIVTLSKWLPDEERWEMFSKEIPPLAWTPWPEHPYGGGND